MQIEPFGALASVRGGKWPEDAAVAAIDTSSYDGVLGWPMRNLCTLLATHFPGATVPIVALRASMGQLSAEHSVALRVRLPDASILLQAAKGSLPDGVKAVGWEKADKAVRALIPRSFRTLACRIFPALTET
jgi:hypothetical protein